MMAYSQLPTEIKLNILSQAHPQDLYKLADSSSDTSTLISHIINKKLESYLKHDKLLISLFSPNNKESNYKIYYTVDFQIDEYYTTFNIDALHHKENVLKPSTTTTEKSQESYSLEQQNHLEIALNEDQSLTKVSFSLKLDSSSLVETSLRLNKSLSKGSQQLDTLAFQYSLLKGEQVPEKGGYDFDISYNYSLNFKDFKIDNIELLKMIESDQQGLIVRY